MRRTGLYSSTPRPRPQVGAAGGVQAAAPATPGAAGARPSGGSAAAAAGGDPTPPTPMSRGGWLRQRIGSGLRRHERTVLVLTGVLIALAVVFSRDALQSPPRALTQDDIDNAVLHTLETRSIPSRASKAAEAVRQSVVRVLGHMDEAEPAPGKVDGAGRAGGEPGGGLDRGGERHADRGAGKDGGKAAGKGDDRPADKAGSAHSTGSGVVIVEDGVILTNLHVVAGAKRISVVFFDGTESEAVLVNAFPENDLAVLKAKTVPDDLPAATLGSTANLRPGDEVVAVGFPFGIGPSVSAGVVSGLNREFLSPKGKRLLTRLIQFDAAANPGNSGGPLVTMGGEVVGIVTAILSPNQAGTFIGIGFATTIEAAGAAVGLPPF